MTGPAVAILPGRLAADKRLPFATASNRATGFARGEALLYAMRGGSVCLHRLAVWISGSPLIDHARREATDRSISGRAFGRQAECGRTAL